MLIARLAAATGNEIEEEIVTAGDLLREQGRQQGVEQGVERLAVRIEAAARELSRRE